MGSLDGVGTEPRTTQECPVFHTGVRPQGLVSLEQRQDCSGLAE